MTPGVTSVRLSRSRSATGGRSEAVKMEVLPNDTSGQAPHVKGESDEGGTVGARVGAEVGNCCHEREAVGWREGGGSRGEGVGEETFMHKQWWESG